MDVVHISVREGEIQDAGSWLYVWVPTGRPEVIYVGGTGLPPVLRAWLHLHHDDPSVARIADRYPGAATESLEVVACRLPDDLDRPTAKAELISQLHQRQLLAADYVGDPPGGSEVSERVRRCVEAVVDHVVSTFAR
jgi:hypothetical protein